MGWASSASTTTESAATAHGAGRARGLEAGAGGVDMEHPGAVERQLGQHDELAARRR